MVIPNKATLDAVVALVLIVFLVGTGWWVRGLYEAKKDLVAERIAAAEREAFIERESKVADRVEKRLAELKANERVIERVRIKLVDRPVYRRDCIDDDGLQFLEAVSRGAAPAKPAAALPDGAATPDG